MEIDKRTIAIGYCVLLILVRYLAGDWFKSLDLSPTVSIIVALVLCLPIVIVFAMGKKR